MKTSLLTAAILVLAVSATGTAEAAGPGGLARSAFHAVMPQTAIASVMPEQKPYETDYQAVQALNIAVNESFGALDAYFDGFSGSGDDSGRCSDCARIKQDEMLRRGAARDSMRIGYLTGTEGLFERVLILETEGGTLVLDNRAPHM